MHLTRQGFSLEHLLGPITIEDASGHFVVKRATRIHVDSCLLCFLECVLGKEDILCLLYVPDMMDNFEGFHMRGYIRM